METVFKGAFSGVAFDLDGVIIDSEIPHMNIYVEILKGFGVVLEPELYNQFVGKTDQEITAIISAREALPVSSEALQDRYHEALAIWLDAGDLPVIPGVRELIRTLHSENIRLALASSSSHMNIEKSLSAAGLREYFEVIVGAEDIRAGKPAPDIYLEAVARLGLQPGDCAAIEDAHFGVLSAKSAGLYTVGFQNPNSGDQDLSRADLIVSAMTQLFR